MEVGEIYHKLKMGGWGTGTLLVKEAIYRISSATKSAKTTYMSLLCMDGTWGFNREHDKGIIGDWQWKLC